MYYLGIDGGGTKTALVACTAEGREVASALCGPLNYNFIGLNAALANLENSIKLLRERAQIRSLFTGKHYFTSKYRIFR